jgi:hypothetical protein
MPEMLEFDHLCRRAAANGLAVRGAFHPNPGEFGAADFYPSGSPSSPLPFQRLARRCEPVHPSPIGLLIHETYGLWHAYRGGLSLRERLSLPSSPPRSSPCDLCADQPCLSACPVQAFRDGSFELDACVRHVRSSAGTECRESGCLARRTCPVGPQFRYTPPQARFHMSALLRSVRSP